MKEFKLSIIPPEFGSEKEFLLGKKLTPLNIMYLKHVQADLLNELLQAENIIDSNVRFEQRAKVLGGLNILASIIEGSESLPEEM